MDAGALHAFLLGLREHAFEVIDVGVDVAVGEEADEVESGAMSLDVGDHLLPGGALVERAGVDRFGDQRGPLVIDAAAADGVVADFGVAHVVVGGHADGGAVGLEGGVEAGGEQMVEVGLVGGEDEIAFGVLADADAVHDDEDDGALGTGVVRDFLEFQGHGISNRVKRFGEYASRDGEVQEEGSEEGAGGRVQGSGNAERKRNEQGRSIQP